MSLNDFIDDARRAFLSGKAYKRLELGNFLGAVNLLEKKYHEKPDSENIEYTLYWIGYCHFKIGNLKVAIGWLSEAYAIYNKNILVNSSPSYRNCYRDLSELYCKVLRIAGSDELADQIMHDLDF